MYVCVYIYIYIYIDLSLSLFLSLSIYIYIRTHAHTTINQTNTHNKLTKQQQQHMTGLLMTRLAAGVYEGEEALRRPRTNIVIIITTITTIHYY